jgi:hypothetical protein
MHSSKPLPFVGLYTWKIQWMVRPWCLNLRSSGKIGDRVTEKHTQYGAVYIYGGTVGLFRVTTAAPTCNRYLFRSKQVVHCWNMVQWECRDLLCICEFIRGPMWRKLARCWCACWLGCLLWQEAAQDALSSQPRAKVYRLVGGMSRVHAGCGWQSGTGWNQPVEALSLGQAECWEWHCLGWVVECPVHTGWLVAGLPNGVNSFLMSCRLITSFWWSNNVYSFRYGQQMLLCPNQTTVLRAKTCTKRKLTSLCLLTIPAFDHIIELNNRHLNSNLGYAYANKFKSGLRP